MTTAAREDDEFWAAVDRAVQAQHEVDQQKMRKEGVNPGNLPALLLSREEMAAAFHRQIAIFNIDYGTAGFNPNAIHPVTGQRKTGSQLTSN
jgi:hypothetical protein